MLSLGRYVYETETVADRIVLDEKSDAPVRKCCRHHTPAGPWPHLKTDRQLFLPEVGKSDRARQFFPGPVGLIEICGVFQDIGLPVQTPV